MSIVVRCKDLDFDCDHVVEAESEEDALSLVAEHASEVHGIDEVSPEMIERVKAVIERDPIES